VKRPQLLTIGAAALLIAIIYFGAKKKPNQSKPVAETHSPDDGHNHGAEALTIDTFLAIGKKNLSATQSAKISQLENSISRGDVKDQQIHVYHQLAKYWHDSANSWEPYAWYTAEAARLENSEKNLTFAAHLFLDNLIRDDVAERRKWKALQAKDLFERSLKLNPVNDSSKVGLGACYLFGNISDNPMEGIQKLKEVADRDSNNVYAQITLAEGSLMTQQFDKAESRLALVLRHQPDRLEAILMMADLKEKTGHKQEAADWYSKSLPFINNEAIMAEINNRINELRK
jgi:tetratricopeptide (TPR) repeat protein